MEKAGFRRVHSFLGLESVLASHSSRATIFQKKRPFSSIDEMGDAVPFHGPTARRDARSTFGCGASLACSEGLALRITSD